MSRLASPRQPDVARPPSFGLALAAGVAALMFGACGGGDTEGGRSAGVATRASTTAVGLETASLLDDRLIAYSTGDAMNSDIQVSKWDGSDPVRLTDAPGFEYDPEWSPDGAKIAYRVEPPGEDFGPSYIYVMDSDGSSQTNLSERSGLLGSAPSWSPDGERVVFAGGPKDAVCSESACEPPTGIYVMNADGSKPQRLTSDAWEAQYPAWSPDGRRIAFVSLEHGNPDVYVMNADGSRVTQLTDDPGPDVWPVWSPDGRRIAFGREGERSELLVMEADGSNKTLLKAVGENRGGVPVNWAPGEWIAFNCLGAVVGQAGNGIGICAVRPEGTGFTRLLGGAEAGFPAWSPRR